MYVRCGVVVRCAVLWCCGIVVLWRVSGVVYYESIALLLTCQLPLTFAQP